MINHKGRVVFSALVNPGRPIPLDVIKIHGIDNLDVKDAPPWSVIGKFIAGLIQDKTVVCYNAAFDIHLIVTLFQRYDIPIPDFEVECAMEMYSQFVGEYSTSKGDFKWQKLPKLAYGKAHDSLVDCESTRLLMKKMAGDLSDEVSIDDVSLDF